jgi:hypothetical protein
MCGCGLDSSSSELRLIAGACEYDNVRWGSIKGRELL